MTARLTLISHASTDAVRRAAFPVDEPLDAQGSKRAAAMAGHLPRAVHCWTSPELRTRQTTEALGLNADVQPLLRDCDYGSWRGLTFDEVQTREPDAAGAWLRDPAAAPHGGESLLALIQRVAAWLDGGRAQRQQVIVVTHPAIIRAAVVHALKATPESFWRIDIAPLSCTRLSGLDGRWNLVSTGCSIGGDA
jgi:broad specificity phosphatase PhoE